MPCREGGTILLLCYLVRNIINKHRHPEEFLQEGAKSASSFLSIPSLSVHSSSLLLSAFPYPVNSTFSSLLRSRSLKYSWGSTVSSPSGVRGEASAAVSI